MEALSGNREQDVTGDDGVNAQTRIYLLRHGETVWNLERRIQGHRDSPLTDRGRRQALANAERLSALLADGAGFRFFSSPLGRCRQTTALICSVLGFDARNVEFDDRLREYGYGIWEGKTKAEIVATDAERFAAREADRWGIAAPGGESYAHVAHRLRDWLADVSGHTIVAVSHGCAGRILRGVFAGLSETEIASLSEAHEEIHVLSNARFETVRQHVQPS